MNIRKAIVSVLVIHSMLSWMPAVGQTVVATDETIGVQLMEIPPWDMVPFHPTYPNPPQGSFDLSYIATPVFNCSKTVSVNPIIHSDPGNGGAYHVFGFIRMNTLAQYKYTRGGMLITYCMENPKSIALYLDQRHQSQFSTTYFITTRMQTSLLGQFRSTAQRRGWIKFEYYQ